MVRIIEAEILLWFVVLYSWACGLEAFLWFSYISIVTTKYLSRDFVSLLYMKSLLAGIPVERVMVIQCSAIQPHLIWDKHHTEFLLDQIFGEHFIYDTCILAELYAQKSAAVVFLYWHGKAIAYLTTTLDNDHFLLWLLWSCPCSKEHSPPPTAKLCYPSLYKWE